VAVFEFASFWGVRLQKLAKIDFQDFLEEAASMFPTDARLLKLLNRAREILVRAARQRGRHQAAPVLSPGGQVRADQASALRQAKHSSAPRRPYLGRVIREVARRDVEQSSF